ncbi:MAG TPA: HNH endonuclease signature motif containing protein, partial [Vicinamibacterales bacterium]
MNHRDSFAALSDQQLVEQADRFALDERQSTANLVASLAELDARRLYLPLGYRSLFEYCTRRHHLSEHSALNRIEVARASRTFPVILDHLADGALTLTAVRLLRPLLTRENHAQLLASARHLGKDEVLHLIARLRPQPPVPSTIRKLPQPRVVPQALPQDADVASPQPAVESRPLATAVAPTPSRRPVIAPLSEEHYRIQVTFTRRAHDKLRQAQALLRHQLPGGDAAAVLERGLDALLADLLKKKAAAVQRPRAPRASAPKGRHIPADVQRKAWIRDGARCAFKSRDGRRCTATGHLEYHHVVPFAAGGQATVDNIELRCRAHNAYEAERFFGPEVTSLFRETAPTYHPGARRCSALGPVLHPNAQSPRVGGPALKVRRGAGAPKSGRSDVLLTAAPINTGHRACAWRPLRLSSTKPPGVIDSVRISGRFSVSNLRSSAYATADCGGGCGGGILRGAGRPGDAPSTGGTGRPPADARVAAEPRAVQGHREGPDPVR